MRIAVTGHRPDKLGGYNNLEAHKAIRRHMRAFLEQAPDVELALISGGALGIDQFWMEVGIFLGLSVIAALPFEGFDRKWPATSRRKLDKLLDHCDEVLYVCEPGYHPNKLQKRNEWMVDNCSALVAYWNGTPGGTANCLDYAGVQGVQATIYNSDEIIHATRDTTRRQSTRSH